MAIIPEFQRQRLASSRVGTPGVDNSGQILARSVQSASSQVGSAAFRLAAERQAAKDSALANKALIDFDLETTKRLKKHQSEQSEFRGDTADRVKMFQDQAEELFSKSAETIQSRGARDIFERQGLGVIRQKVNQEIQAADRNQVTLAFNDTIDSANQLALTAAQLAETDDPIDIKLEQLNAIRKRGQETLEAGSPLLDAKNRQVLKDSVPEMIDKGFLLTSLKDHPQDVLSMIEDGVFNDSISEKDIREIKGRAEKALVNLKDRVEFKQKLDILKENDDLVDKYSEGTLSFVDIEKKEDEATRELFRDLLLEQNPLTQDEQADRFLSLTNRFEELVNKKGKAKGTLEDLLDYQKDLVQARIDKVITQDQLNSLNKKLARPLYQRLEKAKSPGFFDNLFGSVEVVGPKQGFAQINEFLESSDKVGDLDLKKDMVEDFFAAIDKTSPQSEEDYIALAKAVTQQYGKRLSPKAANMENPPDAAKGANGVVPVQGSGSKAKADATVKGAEFEDFEDPLTKVKWRKFKDGKWQKLS
jgi:hypothetical protein